MKNTNKGFSSIAVLIVIGVVVMGSGLYYFTFKNNSDAESVQQSSTSFDSEDFNDSDSNISTYNNSELGVSFNYPKDWTVSEKNGGVMIEKEIDNELRLLFSVGSIKKISYFPQSDEKGQFLGRESYTRNFKGCVNEGGDSKTACYLTITNVITGPVLNRTSIGAVGTDISADGLDITYGVSGAFKTNQEARDATTAGSLKKEYSSNLDQLTEILNSLEIE